MELLQPLLPNWLPRLPKQRLRLLKLPPKLLLLVAPSSLPGLMPVGDFTLPITRRWVLPEMLMAKKAVDYRPWFG
jgi:hypothetical protein